MSKVVHKVVKVVVKYFQMNLKFKCPNCGNTLKTPWVCKCGVIIKPVTEEKAV